MSNYLLRATRTAARHRTLHVWVISIGMAFAAAVTAADKIVVAEQIVTATPAWETTPRLGNDGISDLVVFTRRDMLADGGLGKGDIWYQRLASGVPLGAAVQVTSGTQDNQLNDVSGDYIVYSAYDSTSSMSGRIMLYQISTNYLFMLGNALVIQEPRISGNKVVWREGGANATQVLLYDLAWLGTALDPTVIAGPIPPTFNVEIGDRFVVWAEQTSGQYDLVAFDLVASARIDLTGTPATSERLPATDGPWIVWQAQDAGASSIRIVARNIDTGEERVVVDDGNQNTRPTISGDVIAYEAQPISAPAVRDIWVYRLFAGDKYQITGGGIEHYLNDVFGSNVAYVDQRTGNEDVYISQFKFALPLTAIISPVASAYVGAVVHIDGGGSTDPNGLTLNYQWGFVPQNGDPPVPAGSGAQLVPDKDNPSKASFTPDVAGKYHVQLVVYDTWLASQPVTADIQTTNRAPVASSGGDGVIAAVGATVILDGSASYDPDGDALTFNWNFYSKPLGSGAVLVGDTNANNQKASFIADSVGTYVVQLVVSDGSLLGKDKATWSFKAVKPVASAGPSQTAFVGETVILDGTGSSDANGLPLSYQWSFTSLPPHSSTKIQSPTAVNPTFVPDVPGIYIAQLIVSDAELTSDPSTAQIKALSDISYVHTYLMDAIALIGSLDKTSFKNWGMRNLLIRGLHDVMEDAEHHHYRDAMDDVNGIVRRVDGCTLSGAPDRDDWILSCPAQQTVYQDLQNVRAAIQPLKDGCN